MFKYLIKAVVVLPLLFFYADVKAGSGSDEAIKHYYEGEYQEALDKITPFFRDNPTSSHLYNYFFNSLIELEKFDRLEDELKDLESEHPETPRFAVDLGYIYSLRGDQSDAEEQYQKIINNLPDDETLVKTTGNAFERRGETEMAVATFETARDKAGDEKAYKYQLAELYKSSEEYNKMFEEYLMILSDNQEYKRNVQNNIQELVMEGGYFDDFRQKLLGKVQEEPQNSAYTELFSWLFIQKEDFEEAFRQLRSIDQRLNEEGERLLDLAEVVINHQSFDVAEDIYRYVAGIGEDGRYYMEARQGLLDVKFRKLQEGLVSYEDVDQIVEAYEEHIEIFGYSQRGASQVFLNLAEIKAVYQNQPRAAIDLLEEYKERGRGGDSEMARAKMNQARYHTFMGETWRASLLYGQIDADFRDHPLGHEAKFRNAKLSFYRGDFEWALAQLEVLKGATADMYANDALSLSLSIRDAVGLDTTKHPLELFAEADLLKYQRQYDRAMEKMDELLNEYPGHSLEENVLLNKAEIKMEQRQFEEAFRFYEELYTEHPDGILADEALYKAARLKIDRFEDIPEGVKLLEELIFNHPDSFFTVDGRQEYRDLQGELP